MEQKWGYFTLLYVTNFYGFFLLGKIEERTNSEQRTTLEYEDSLRQNYRIKGQEITHFTNSIFLSMTATFNSI